MAYETNTIKERLTDTFGFTMVEKVEAECGPDCDCEEELARPGPKSAAQTPAPPKERIKGSKENPEGTAATRSKAGDIEISEANEQALKDKIAEFKKDHPNRKTPSLGTLKKVFRRGAGAFSTSFRPTISGGKPNSRNAWAMARVNKFLKMAGGGEVKESYRKADGDLLEKRLKNDGIKKTEFVAGRDCGQDDEGTFGPDNKCAVGYGRPPLSGGYTPKRPGGKFPKDYVRPTPQTKEKKPAESKPLPPPPPPTGGAKPTAEKQTKKSIFPNAIKDYDSKEVASLSSAISGNEKRLESLRQNIIKKTEDEQKELDSAQEKHQTIKQNIKDSQLKLSSLISARSQYDIEKDRDKYIENKNLMEREYAKLESLRKESEIQQKQVNEVKLKIRKAGLEEIKKDMLEVNKQDGFSSEQLNKATEELKQKQQSAIAEDRKSIRESKDAFATQERERAQERLREIFNPHIHSESLSKPVE